MVGLGSACVLSPASASHSPSASEARVPSASSSPGAGQASISGRVSYPAEILVAQDIYAMSTDGKRFYVVETVSGQRSYFLSGLAPGDYYVLTAARDVNYRSGVTNDKQPYRFGAAYTRSVVCGLTTTCTDHSLIPVHLDSGSAATGVDPGDWYNSNRFPVIPAGGPAPVSLPNPSTPQFFGDARQAGSELAHRATVAGVVASESACQPNLACVWLTGEMDGTLATYFTATAGSNGVFLSCGFYVASVSAGWYGFDSRCRSAAAPFPAVGSSGRVVIGLGETGCVNVHESPALSSKVVGCLKDGTGVQIDSGPSYVRDSTPINSIDFFDKAQYFWHIAGRGWMIHRYLAFGG